MELKLKIEPLHVAPGIKLVPVALSDANALAALIARNVSHLQTFMPKVVGLGTTASATSYLTSVIEKRELSQVLEWHIVQNGVLCGAVRLNHIELACSKTSIGYYVGADFQGKGLATASVRAVIAYAFEHLGFNRVELRCATGNRASQRVAEHLGFSWEGLLRQAEFVNSEYLDHFVYSILREEFDLGLDAQAAA